MEGRKWHSRSCDASALNSITVAPKQKAVAAHRIPKGTAMIDLLAIAAASTLAAASLSDVAWRIIPNWTVAVLGASGIVAAVATNSIVEPIVIATCLLAVGMVLFAQGVMGGGDVKLMAAMGFWLTTTTLAPFLLIMAMAGGVLALGVVLTVTLSHRDATAAVPTVPYGVAIAVSGLFILLGAH